MLGGVSNFIRTAAQTHFQDHAAPSVEVGVVPCHVVVVQESPTFKRLLFPLNCALLSSYGCISLTSKVLDVKSEKKYLILVLDKCTHKKKLRLNYIF